MGQLPLLRGGTYGIFDWSGLFSRRGLLRSHADAEDVRADSGLIPIFQSGPDDFAAPHKCDQVRRYMVQHKPPIPPPEAGVLLCNPRSLRQFDVAVITGSDGYRFLGHSEQPALVQV